MPAHDPTERALIARLATHTRWARERDRTAATAPARKAAMSRFEREVDPDGTLDPVERARRAESAKQAYFTRLALRSAQARRATPPVGRRSAPEGDERSAREAATDRRAAMEGGTSQRLASGSAQARVLLDLAIERGRRDTP